MTDYNRKCNLCGLEFGYDPYTMCEVWDVAVDDDPFPRSAISGILRNSGK